jgi:hypothetical protein
MSATGQHIMANVRWSNKLVNNALQEIILESQEDSESEPMATAHFPNLALGQNATRKRLVCRHFCG